MTLIYSSENGTNATDPNLHDYSGSNRDTYIQLAISAPLGLIALIIFCILRPRWPGLYAARKKQKDAATILPELPTSFVGWIPVVWRITDQQVLASAGLDAYVFLDFFKMASQYLFITLFFALVVIKPVHDAFPAKETRDDDEKHHKNRHNETYIFEEGGHHNKTTPGYGLPFSWETDFLWMYIVFAYLFSGLAVYLLVTHTRKVISVRQEYLGTQSTITDRTIRLSGIPNYLQDEAKIKDFVEELDIGKVETVVLCRDWNELDTAMRERMDILRRLELAYTIFAGQKANTQAVAQAPAGDAQLIALGDDEDEDSAQETDHLVNTNGQSDDVHEEAARPQLTLRFGNFNLQSRKVDAIDYYSERLRNLDQKIKDLRESDFRPMPLAFVTMDSVAAAQMAIQAVLDPSPLELIANNSPPPSEVVWRNTYQTRRTRMFKAWLVTSLIALLTIFWSALLVPIAGLLNTEAIGQVFPAFAHLLEQHKYIESLVNTQFPVLVIALLTTGVPYLYYYMSWYQGSISVSEIELSAISKNFFFTFFNFFVVFTVSIAGSVVNLRLTFVQILGTASNFYKLLEEFGDALQNFRDVAKGLAQSLRLNLRFYTNFLILQSLTLHPLRLLELGTVSLYPIYLMGAKTPRDYAELVQPPFFTYAYYLPTALLVFIIAMAYSVLRESWTILLAGFSYFFFGHFVYKYQLLYAMDHSPHATGRAWGMICDRVFLAMIFFQITTAGQLIFENALRKTITMIPLIGATIWFSIVFGRTYKPLLKFIALQNIKKAQHDDYTSPDNPLPTIDENEQNVWADPGAEQWRYYRESRSTSPARQDAMRFVNPSLVQPLHGIWIADKRFADGLLESSQNGQESV